MNKTWAGRRSWSSGVDRWALPFVKPGSRPIQQTRKQINPKTRVAKSGTGEGWADFCKVICHKPYKMCENSLMFASLMLLTWRQRSEAKPHIRFPPLAILQNMGRLFSDRSRRSCQLWIVLPALAGVNLRMLALVCVALFCVRVAFVMKMIHLDFRKDTMKFDRRVQANASKVDSMQYASRRGGVQQ